jgi:hypothetical protein
MFRVSSFVLGIMVATACSGGPPHATPQATTSPATPAVGPADLLVERMLRALETEDVVAWRELLSAQMRAKFGSDPAALHDHLMSWRRDVLPIAAQLRGAELAIDATGPEPVVTYAADGHDAIALASVVDEAGELHLDEN